MKPGTVGAAVGASVEDGGGGGGDLRVVAWDAVRGARRAADVARRATRGRRRHRRAQIVSGGAVQAEERERGNKLGGFHRACCWKIAFASLEATAFFACVRIVWRRACSCARSTVC